MNYTDVNAIMTLKNGIVNLRGFKNIGDDFTIMFLNGKVVIYDGERKSSYEDYYYFKQNGEEKFIENAKLYEALKDIGDKIDFIFFEGRYLQSSSF